MPDKPLYGRTPSNAWGEVLKRRNAEIQRRFGPLTNIIDLPWLVLQYIAHVRQLPDPFVTMSMFLAFVKCP